MHLVGALPAHQSTREDVGRGGRREREGNEAARVVEGRPDTIAAAAVAAAAPSLLRTGPEGSAPPNFASTTHCPAAVRLSSSLPRRYLSRLYL